MSILLLCIGLLGLLTSTVYAVMVTVAAIRFRRRKPARAPSDFAPMVSLFKPLHGNEPGLAERLRGFFQQDYSNFEILFCARLENDEGLKIARQIAAEYPSIRSTFLTTGHPHYANAKVHSLELMHSAANGEIFIISDSDAGVDPNYIEGIVRPFADEKVGLVTCIYRGVTTSPGLFSKLEAIGMSIELTAGVIVSTMLSPLAFALGPTMAVRRRCVDQIGTFAALGNYHSDDYVLGNLVARNGNLCVLSDHVIDHFILNTAPWHSIKHQVRWMKTTRFSRPTGHFGTLNTFATPFAALTVVSALLLHQPWVALLAIGISLLSRFAIAFSVGSLVVKEPTLLSTVCLYPIRDFLAFGLWVASYGSRRVLWRGEWYDLEGDGLVPVNPVKRLV